MKSLSLQEFQRKMLVFLHTLLLVPGVLADWLLQWWRRQHNQTFEALQDSDDVSQPWAEYDEGRGVVFYPPVYLQRYSVVCELLSDLRWKGKLEKIVDFGYHDTSFLQHLGVVPGVRTVLGVDLDPATFPQELYKSQPGDSRYSVILYRGNAADPDYRLIGCDAVVAIELVEHMLPHDLERFVHTVFGFVQPWVVIITTPNSDFNVLFKGLLESGFRHPEHFFEWTREQFDDWCSNIVTRYPRYSVSTRGVGPGPPGTDHLGHCSQLALFVCNDYHKIHDFDPARLTIQGKVESEYAQAFSMISQEGPLDLQKDKTCVWKNINWGEDAPLWNCYYAIAKQYDCEAIPTEQRILDLMEWEMVRRWHAAGGDAPIPLAPVMAVVTHLTEDINVIRDILEWNDYPIEGDNLNMALRLRHCVRSKRPSTGGYAGDCEIETVWPSTDR